jgi:superoxide dismutase
MTFAMKPLSCDPSRVRGMSERLIVSHYENNYGGAVKRLDLIADMYEHSYHIDFGAKAATYVDTFMDAIRWNNADRLYAAAANPATGRG